MNLIDPSIDRFYTKKQEEARLSVGLGPLEFERNKSIIQRYLREHSHIADIGGGPGHYAEWLAGLHHHVVLIDPVKKHIDLARKRSRQNNRFTCILGEARNVSLPDKSQDLVILHGPLYHLQQQEDRLAALKETRRVLKKDGIVLGFAITHSASAIAALHSGLIHNSEIFAMCKEELSSGVHHPPEEFPFILADAFYHRPSELVSEFEMAGFEPIEVLPVEGIAWLDGNFFESWADSVKRNRLLQLVQFTEKDIELLSFSPHIVLSAHIKD